MRASLHPEYQSLHYWVRKNKGHASNCVGCGVAGENLNGRWTLQWANVDGLYRKNLDDFIALCYACHRHYDGPNPKYWLGKKLTAELREKLSLAHKGLPSNRKRAVEQLDLKTDEVIARYESGYAAAAATGISDVSISNAVLGKSKSAGGFKWITA